MSKKFVFGWMKDDGDIVPLQIFQTHGAVAYDHLNFVEGVVSHLMDQREDLEAEANQSGRTINHKFCRSMGSLKISNELVNVDE